ncbi:hypothetical protein ACH4PW_36905 [Streptomyces sp. NPDC017082]|uniref:hypothetical protein n=1 Tax=Streptomyces sp. NPDC017082 TaxID=3364974 RepID=UPI0037922A6B
MDGGSGDESGKRPTVAALEQRLADERHCRELAEQQARHLAPARPPDRAAP